MAGEAGPKVWEAAPPILGSSLGLELVAEGDTAPIPPAPSSALWGEACSAEVGAGGKKVGGVALAVCTRVLRKSSVHLEQVSSSCKCTPCYRSLRVAQCGRVGTLQHPQRRTDLATSGEAQVRGHTEQVLLLDGQGLAAQTCASS